MAKQKQSMGCLSCNDNDDDFVSLKRWVSDQLICLIGYANPDVIKYVIQLSKQVDSPADMFTRLQDFGFSSSSSSSSSSFAHQLFCRVNLKRCRAGGGGGGLNVYQEEEKGAALLTKKQRTCSLILDDDCHDQEEKKRETRPNAGGTQKLKEPKLTKREDASLKPIFNDLKADEFDALRRLSRQEYLKRREQKKLEEIRADIQDEKYMFDGVKLTEAEYKEFRYKKEIYGLAKKKRTDGTDNTDAYRMPEAYDEQGHINQQKRFAVALQRYRDPSAGDQVKPFAEQESWENCQVQKASFKFGSRKETRTFSDYQFVFEDRASVMDDDKFDDKLPCKLLDSYSRQRAALEKLQKERKILPIYRFRDELLQAVKDHQVNIIVGETGSGKTTQIPQYLHEAGYTRHGKIACTQPRRVAAMSVAARVAREMGGKLGHEVGYSIRFEDCTSEKTILHYMTDGMLLREFLHEADLARYSVVMVDEAHERTLSTDILFGLLKDLASNRRDLKLLISSATLQAEKFSDFFNSAPMLDFPGRRFPVEIYHMKEPVPNFLDAAIETVLLIHKTEPAGDILVFLPGEDEIETAAEILMHKTRDLGTKISELIIRLIYANLPSDLQAKVFEPTPEGARKVVLATNIAETSLTIDGIKYVVDPGFWKIKSYAPRTEMESLLVAPISKASAMQRAGRSGRTGPGKCFRLYTGHDFSNDMDDNTVPEIQRTNLASVVLTLKSLGIEDVLNFDFMDPPSTESLLKALELLYALNALNDRGELTKVGRKMAKFPLDPMLSKMILASDKYRCSDEIITIAAMLSVGDSIFYRPKEKGKQNLADNARKAFCAGNVGDHVALLNVYNTWKETNYSTQWCYENFVQARSMKRVRDIRDQLVGLLRKVEIELSSNPNDLDAIKKSIASGFFHRFARLCIDGSYRRLKNPLAVHIHPSSTLAKVVPKFVVYSELVLTTKEYMRQVTGIKPQWLLEVAPHYYQRKEVECLEPEKFLCGSKKMPRGTGLASSITS